MVDADTIHDLPLDEVEEQPVHILEHRVLLDPDSDETGHAEEAPVADRVVLGAPMDKLPGLFRMERAQRLGVAATRRLEGGRGRERHAQAPGDQNRAIGVVVDDQTGIRKGVLERRGKPRQPDPSRFRIKIEMPEIAARGAEAQDIAEPRGLD